MTPTTDLQKLLAEATKGPWSYRPQPHDDWGTVRADRFHICQAHDPRFMDQDYLAKCREEKRDPWEANARLIAMAPTLAARLLELEAENKRLREGLEFIAEEIDAGRHDGLPEPSPAHCDVAMWAVARTALKGGEI